MAELAYTYQLAGKQQEAAAIYTRLAKAAKGNIGFRLSAAQAWVNVGQPDAARPFLDDARQIDSNNYRLHAILGSIAESEDRLPEANDEYKLALAQSARSVPRGPALSD